MYLNFILICCFISLLVVINNVNGQVCTRKAVVTSTMSVPYVYTIREQYQTNCWYGGKCTKTRYKANVGYRTVTRKEVKVIEICCNGYIRNETNTESMVCMPICMPSCINGFCKSPAQCNCYEGYFVDTANPHRCIPQCVQGCDHGTCVAPNTCECNFGYVLNTTCQPICTEPCVNGKCTAPDTCECLDGFRKSENNTCEAYCSKGCSHGVCVRPETCACEDGYMLDDEECLPHCKKDCGNGTCIAPDTCECDSGFILENGTCTPICTDSCVNGYCVEPLTCVCNPGYTSDGNSCRPFCRDECGNGICVAPDTCQCDPGYIFNGTYDPSCCEPICDPPCVHGSCIEPSFCACNFGYSKNFITETCDPHCSINCGNGKCIAPETCECDPGYNQDDVDDVYVHDPICEPICIGCEDNCVAPFNCVCVDDTFEARNQTVNGEDCDCFENCSDVSKQCVRTVCLPTLTSTTESLFTIPISYATSNVEPESGIDEDSYDNFYTDIIPLSSDVTEVTPTDNPTSQTTDIKIDLNNSLTYSDKRRKEEPTSHTVWIYVAVAIILLVMTSVAILLILRRKAVKNFFRGGSYVVEEKSENASASIDMNFIAEKKSS